MASIMACRVCLATDVKLYNMYEYGLVNPYEVLTGFQMSHMSPYVQYMCSYCAALLLKCSKFRDKCLYSQDVLSNAERHTLITTDYLRIINRDNLLLPYGINFNPVLYVTENYMVKDEVEQSVTWANSPISFMSEEVVKDEPTDLLVEDTKKFDNIAEINFENMDEDTLRSSDEEPLSIKAERRKQKVVKKKKKRHKINGNDENNHDNVINNDENLELNGDLTNFDKNNDECDNFFNDKVKVVILTKEQQIEELQARKSSRNYLNSLYKCERCFKGFMSDTTYNNHMLRHDPSSGSAECEICGTRRRCTRSLRAHQDTAHRRKYLCAACPHVATSSHRAREHAKWHQGFQYVCKVCGATFSKSTSHLTHMRLRHPSGRPCPLCGEFFLGEYGLRMHTKKAHRSNENSKPKSDRACVVCGVEFRSIQALQSHVNNSKDNICDPALRSCVFCGNNLPTDQELAQHIKEHHHNDSSINCHECGRQFANSRTYAVHRQQFHCASGAPRARSLQGAPLVCETCGATCRTRATLIYHQRAHTGEKPYQCTDCPKRFTILQRLQIHRRTHTGERPFQCPHCPKAFKQKAALNRHDRVHSGVKPYECRRCGKRFSQSNSMKLHERAVHLKIRNRHDD